MKHFFSFSAWAGVLTGCLFLSCARIEEEALSNSQGLEVLLSGTIEEMQPVTKSQRDNTGTFFWSPQDAISLFYGMGDAGGSKFTSVNVTPAQSVNFAGNIGIISGSLEGGLESFFWGVYPYSSENACDGTYITTVIPDRQTAAPNTFADGQFVSIGRSPGLSMSFFNLCGGFKFRLEREGVTKVILRGNQNEDLAGKVKVRLDEESHPLVESVLDGKKTLTLTLPGDAAFQTGVDYFFVIRPIVMAGGFTFTFVTQDHYVGERVINARIPINRSQFQWSSSAIDHGVTYASGEDPDESSGNAEEGGTESGLYLGITYFGSALDNYPLNKLTGQTITGFENFIDSRSDLDYQTWLYYAVDKSMTRLKATQFPNDLFSVAIVTFTDGQDDGSSYQKGKEVGKIYQDGEYEEELLSILEESVNGIPVTAYSVGLGDINDVVFRNDVQTIAHPSTNWAVVDNMDEVNNKFKAIAQELSNTIKLQRFTGTIPGQAAETKIRFTFDNIGENNGAAANSQLYIEGVFDVVNGVPVLKNVEYRGLSSTSGKTVQGVEIEDSRIRFSFAGLRRNDKLELNLDYYQRWIYRTKLSIWQVYKETQSESAQSIIEERRSAAIILNLDCTVSLGAENFKKLKQYSKSFINTLYNNSIDPNKIESVQFNKTNMGLVVGQSETLQATLSPSTASGNNLVWSSAIPSVATVNQSGHVTAVSEGTTIISVSTEDGKEMATCVVNVSFQHVESVSLNKSNLTMYEGKNETLIATVTPADASDASVEWTSSAPNIVTVSPNGTVRALSKGSATITVKTTDGEKTATCSVVVTDYTPSTSPLDLSLAVYSPKLGRRGYIAYEELQYANLNDYTVEGLTILSASGDFIIALEDASSSGIVYDAASTFYTLPTYNQGVTISARLTEINNALTDFGGERLNSYYYWTSGASSSTSYYCFYQSGGSLISLGKTSTWFVREAIPLSSPDLHTFVTKSKGLLISYIDSKGNRCFAENRTAVPAGCTIEGLAIGSSTGKGNVIIALEDANASQVSWSAAKSVYGINSFITEEEGKLISARLNEVNTALINNGGESFKSYYYWTSGASSSASYYYCIRYSGGSLSTQYDTNNAYLRKKKGTYTPYESCDYYFQDYITGDNLNVTTDEQWTNETFYPRFGGKFGVNSSFHSCHVFNPMNEGYPGYTAYNLSSNTGELGTVTEIIIPNPVTGSTHVINWSVPTDVIHQIGLSLDEPREIVRHCKYIDDAGSEIIINLHCVIVPRIYF